MPLNGQSQQEKRFSPSRKTLSKREIVVSNKDILGLTGTLAEHVTGIFIGDWKSVIKVKRKKEHSIESDVHLSSLNHTSKTQTITVRSDVNEIYFQIPIICY